MKLREELKKRRLLSRLCRDFSIKRNHLNQALKSVSHLPWPITGLSDGNMSVEDYDFWNNIEDELYK